MNKLLVRVYLFLLIMFIIAMVHLGAIQNEIFTTGHILGQQIVESEDLHTFYKTLNELLRTRFMTESSNLDDLMSSDIETLTQKFEIGDTVNLISVYDDNHSFVAGSDTKSIDENSDHINTRQFNRYMRILLPPRQLSANIHVECETADKQRITLVLKPTPNALNILNTFTKKTYTFSLITIIISIVSAFLPIGIYFYINYIRPLNKLQNAANAIAQGNLNVNIDERGLYEIKEFSRAFENMRHELEESKKREQRVLENRQQLITNISHDLRTPITSISGYVEGLLDGKGKNPERMERYLKTIKSKTEYLNTMINDLFLFSQMDMDGYSLELAHCNSRDLLERLLEPVELWLDDTSFNLKIVRPFPSVPLRADYMRLSQVFENIIQNSIKYSNDDGQLTIESYIKNHQLVINFTDNGIGISEKSLPFIFDAFYREDKSRTQSLGGAGLGLSICKKIIELHGGIIRVASVVGEGTKLVVYLPLERIQNI